MKKEEIYQENNNQDNPKMAALELNKDKNNKNAISQNDNILYEEEIPQREENVKLRPSAYSSTQKTKSRIIEENKEISDFTTNKKFRNTISGLNSNKLKFQKANNYLFISSSNPQSPHLFVYTLCFLRIPSFLPCRLVACHAWAN